MNPIELFFALIETSRGWNIVALALVSFVVHALAANIAWNVQQSPDSELAVQLRAARAQTGVRAGFEFLRLVFYLGIPFAALYVGWLDLRVVGLGFLDWAQGVRWAIVILLAAWLILMFIWLPYLRATADVFAAPDASRSFPRRLVEMLYMQAHWMFYRGAAIILFVGVIPEAFYWGTVLGFGLIALETFADPRVRDQLRRVGAADMQVWNLGQAIINTLAFVVTRNFFLLLFIQLALELTVPHLRPTAAPRRAPALPGTFRQLPPVQD